jgi:hypothetical protein
MDFFWMFGMKAVRPAGEKGFRRDAVQAYPLSWLWNNVKLSVRVKAIGRSHRVEEVAPIKNSR